MAKAQTVEGVANGWEREESRIVRPFLSAEDYLKDATLRLYIDDNFDGNPTIHLESLDRERLSPAVRVSVLPIDFEELVGVPLKELSLIVAIEDRVFKNSVVIHSLGLVGFKGGVIELGEAAQEYAGWSGDTRIHIAVVLGKNRKSAVGIASRGGSWVAKKTFSISKARDNANFEIKPVDDDWFKTRGLPPSTTYYVEMLSSDLNQPCDAMPDLVKVYMHQSVHNSLARDEESVIGRALIKSVYVDVVSNILTVGFGNVQVDELQPGTILDVVASRLAKETGVSREKLIQIAKDTSGTHLRALIQAEAELTRAMVVASGRKMS